MEGQDEPKPIKKMSLVAESYVTITWKGFFTQSQIVLSSIVGYSQQNTHYSFIHLNLFFKGWIELAKG